MNSLLERLGGFAARRHWIVIIGWLIILGGLLGARQAFGGEFVNNYTVSGSDSTAGLNVLSDTFPQQGGYRRPGGLPCPQRHGHRAADGGE